MRLTKRPSASHWLNGNIALKIAAVALRARKPPYPIGPGGNSSSPGNSRLLMYSIDKYSKPIPKAIVKNKNKAVVWATSAHLTPFPIGFAGLSNVAIHCKNSATTIPKRVSPTGAMSRDAQVCGSAHRRILRQLGVR